MTEKQLVQCPACGNLKKVKAALAGKRAECPCGENFELNAVTGSTAKAKLWSLLTTAMQDGETAKAESCIDSLRKLKPSVQEQQDLEDLASRLSARSVIKSDRELIERPAVQPQKFPKALIVAGIAFVGFAAFAGSYFASQPTELAKVEPVQPEPVQPEPVQPEPVQPEPVQPEPVQPEPVQPEPVQPESVLQALTPSLDAIFAALDKQPAAADLANVVEPSSSAEDAAKWIAAYWRRPNTRQYTRHATMNGTTYIEVIEDDNPRIVSLSQQQEGYRINWNTTKSLLTDSYAAQDAPLIDPDLHFTGELRHKPDGGYTEGAIASLTSSLPKQPLTIKATVAVPDLSKFATDDELKRFALLDASYVTEFLKKGISKREVPLGEPPKSLKGKLARLTRLCPDIRFVIIGQGDLASNIVAKMTQKYSHLVIEQFDSGTVLANLERIGDTPLEEITGSIFSTSKPVVISQVFIKNETVLNKLLLNNNIKQAISEGKLDLDISFRHKNRHSLVHVRDNKASISKSLEPAVTKHLILTSGRRQSILFGWLGLTHFTKGSPEKPAFPASTSFLLNAALTHVNGRRCPYDIIVSRKVSLSQFVDDTEYSEVRTLNIPIIRRADFIAVDKSKSETLRMDFHSQVKDIASRFEKFRSTAFVSPAPE